MRSPRNLLSAIGQEAAGLGGRGNPGAGVAAAISPAVRSLHAAGLADYAAGACCGRAAVFLADGIATRGHHVLHRSPTLPGQHCRDRPWQCTVLRRELARQPAGSPDGFELIGDGARHEAVIEDVSGRRR